jgi:hypothetical protein
VRPSAVVEADELFKDDSQMPFIEGYEVIQAFAAYGAD